jgi:hypothetical protein
MKLFFGWEACLNAVPHAEKAGEPLPDRVSFAGLFSIDPGYLENIGGRFRVVVGRRCVEVYGPHPEIG